jgi:hypothetical protein
MKHISFQSYLTDRLDELQTFLGQLNPPKREILLGERLANKTILDQFNDVFKEELIKEKSNE